MRRSACRWSIATRRRPRSRALLDHVDDDAQLPKLVMLPLIAARRAVRARRSTRVLARHSGRSAGVRRSCARAAGAGGDARAISTRRSARKKLQGAAPPAPPAGGQRRRDVRHARASRRRSRRALADFLTLEARGWKGRAGTAARAATPTCCSSCRAPSRRSPPKAARAIDRLTRDGMPLAAAITLRAGDTRVVLEDRLRRGVRARLARRAAHARPHRSAARRRQHRAAPIPAPPPDHPMIDHLWRERLALTDL